MTLGVDTVRRALALHAGHLIDLPNVVGLGVAIDPEPCLAVYVTTKLPLSALAEHDRVPRTVRVEGVQVHTRVVETGRMERQGEREP